MLHAKQHQMVQPEGVDVTTHTRPTADTSAWRASRNAVPVGPRCKSLVANMLFQWIPAFQRCGSGTKALFLHLDIRERRTARNIETSIRVLKAGRYADRKVPLQMSGSHPPQNVHARCTLHGSRRDLRLVVPGADITHLGTQNNRSTGHGRACPVDLLVAKGCRCAHVPSVLKVYFFGSPTAISLLLSSADAVRTSNSWPRVVV